MNVADTILQAGDAAAPAIHFEGRTVTYAELRGRVAGLASGLLAQGHSKGERLGIVAENNPFFVVAYLASLRAGLVAVPLPPELPAASFQRMAMDAGLRAVFISNHWLGRVAPWAEELGFAILSEAEEQRFAGEEIRPAQKLDECCGLAALMFTSGATGLPKAVMVTHRNIECNTRDIIAYLGLSRADKVMVVLPFHYCYGLSLLHTHLLAGGSVVLNNQFRLFPESVLTEMQESRCTGFAGVPSTYQILLRKSRFRQMEFPGLRWFQQAGGPLPNPCIQEIRTAFPQVRYFLMYGQTEGTARLSYLPPDRLADKLGSIGKGLPSTRLEVLAPDGTPVSPGSLETGEIVASGDNITRGYWNDALETARVFKNGRLHTGDLAHVDAEGFIFIVDRERDMIKSGGNRVGAREVEDVIAELPDVVQVAVLGTPDELLGEAVKAFVVPTPDAKIGPKEVERHCRRRLPAFKTPREIIFLEHLPHNSAGKILKPKLKEMLAHRGTPLLEAQVP